MKTLDFEVMSSVEGGKNCKAISAAGLGMTIASIAGGLALSAVGAPAVAAVLIFAPSEIALGVASVLC